MANRIQLDEQSSIKRFGSLLYKGMMNGISNIIPIILIGGLFLALIDIIGMEILGWNLRGDLAYIQENGFREFLYIFRQIALTALGLMIPFLAGFTAQGIGGKAALAPGFLGGMIAKGGAFGHIEIAGSGFLGGVFAGAVAGFIVLLIKKIPFSKKYESLNNLFVTPLLAALIVALPMVYFVGPLITTLNNSLTNGLTWMADNNLTLLLGFIIGVMACFDFGGPINKIAYVFTVGLWADGHHIFYSAFTISKIIPGITIGIAALVFPKLFTKDEQDGAIASIILSGLGGISEQVIPYALRDPLRIIPAQMIGGGIAAALTLYSAIEIGVGAGGSLITALVTSNPLLWLIYFVIGSAVAMALMVILKSVHVKNYPLKE